MIIGVAEAKRIVGETNTSMSGQEFCEKYGAIPLDNSLRHNGKPMHLFDSEQIEQIAYNRQSGNNTITVPSPSQRPSAPPMGGAACHTEGTCNGTRQATRPTRG